MKELTVPARLEELGRVISFIDAELKAHGCPENIQMQVDVAVEEIYVNIASYAYYPGDGNATVRCGLGGEPLRVTIQFSDHGMPYNPLAKADPDVSLTAEERSFGGLGIYMVKKSMDMITYKYEDGTNILTIQKSLIGR